MLAPTLEFLPRPDDSLQDVVSGRMCLLQRLSLLQQETGCSN